MTDLRGADSLLQKAIKRVDNRNPMDTAQVTYIYIYTVLLLNWCMHHTLIFWLCFLHETGSAAMH